MSVSSYPVFIAELSPVYCCFVSSSSLSAKRFTNQVCGYDESSVSYIEFHKLYRFSTTGLMVATGREIILYRLTHSMIIEWLPVAGEVNTEAVDEGRSRSVKHFST